MSSGFIIRLISANFAEKRGCRYLTWLKMFLFGWIYDF